jgi:ferritin-like metal-binding protein YciE
MLDPTLAISLIDNWVKFNLRYIVDLKKRRLTQHLLNEEIYKKIKETEGQVRMVSTTLEVIKISDLKSRS